MSVRRGAAAVLLAVAMLALAPALAGATVIHTWTGAQPPPGYRLGGQQVVRMAEATRVAQQALQKSPLDVSVGYYGSHRWQVTFTNPRNVIAAEVHVDDRTGRVVEAYGGAKAANRGLRGSSALVAEGEIGSATDSVFVWVSLVILFALPLVDFRRIRRWVHLEVLAFMTFAVAHLPSASGDLRLWSILLYPFLLLLIARLVAAARGGDSDEELVPHVSMRWIAIGLVGLFAARTALNIVNSIPADVAYANVAGADRILHHQELYTAGGQHYDTYGPWSYLLYVPFNLVFGFKGVGDAALVSAHAASLTFDFLSALALFLLGRDLRPGAAGTRLGLTLAYLWFANPFTWNALAWNTNDAVVSSLGLFAVLWLRRPVLSGLTLGLAGGVKFVSFALIPLFAADRARRGPRAGLSLALAGAAVAVAGLALVVTPAHLRDFWDATLGFQFHRSGEPYSIWNWYSALAPLHVLVEIAVLAGIAGVTFFTRSSNKREIAAWSGAIVAGILLTMGHVAEPYFVWFVGFGIFGIFARYR